MAQTRKLYRSDTDRIIFGVCGGLAEYFGVDSMIMRVVFIMLAFLDGIGILAYLILAAVLPTKVGEHIASESMETPEAAPDPLTGMTHKVFRDEDISRRRSLVGLILVIGGLTYLAYTFFPFAVFQWRFAAPLMLIVFGFFIILRK